MVKIIDNFEITFISSMEIDSFSHHSGEGKIYQVHVIVKEIGENKSNNIVCFVEIIQEEGRCIGFDRFMSSRIETHTYIQKAIDVSINHRGSKFEEIDIDSPIIEAIENLIEESDFICV